MVRCYGGLWEMLCTLAASMAAHGCSQLGSIWGLWIKDWRHSTHHRMLLLLPAHLQTSHLRRSNISALLSVSSPMSFPSQGVFSLLFPALLSWWDVAAKQREWSWRPVLLISPWFCGSMCFWVRRPGAEIYQCCSILPCCCHQGKPLPWVTRVGQSHVLMGEMVAFRTSLSSSKLPFSSVWARGTPAVAQLCREQVPAMLLRQRVDRQR